MYSTVWAVVKGHHIPAAAVTAVAASVALSFLPGLIWLPQFHISAGVEARTGLLCAAVSALVILTVLNEPAAPIAATAPRNWTHWRLYRIVGVTIVAGGLLVAARPGTALAAVVPLIALLGEGMIGARIIGPTRGWVLPLIHLGAAIGFGMTSSSTAHAWAWFIAPDPGVGEAVISAIAYLVGLASWAPATSAAANSD